MWYMINTSFQNVQSTSSSLYFGEIHICVNSCIFYYELVIEDVTTNETIITRRIVFFIYSI